MGVKKCKTALVLILLSLLSPVTVYADSASDLYKIYDIDYSTVYPKGVIKTIEDYNNAQKFLKSFRYVVTSEYDYSIIDNRIKKLTAEKESITELLLSGYSLSWEEIYELEDRYVTVSKQLEDAKLSLSSNSIEYDKPDTNTVPTTEEYEKALADKAAIDTKTNVGTLSNLEPPLESACLLDSSSDVSTTYQTVKGSVVTAIFNGEVCEVGEDYIILNNYNGIKTYYRNLKSVNVSVGDTVYQNQAIATSNSYVTLQLSLDGNFVNLTKLYNKE